MGMTFLKIRRREYNYYHMDEKSTEGKENKYEAFHHQVLLLLVKHKTSMKSFQALRSPVIPLTSFHDLPVPLISSSIVLRHVLICLPLLLYA